MSELVARTGRQQQRCIPFKFRDVEENGGDISRKVVEVLMINSTSGPGLLFPKRTQHFETQGSFSHRLLLLLFVGSTEKYMHWHTASNVFGFLQYYTGGWGNDETVEEQLMREAMRRLESLGI
nr:nudix hydrolase 16, mitochondrial-like [Ipomoea batatas]